MRVGNHYEATFLDANSHSGGIQGNVGRNWTQVLRSTLSVEVEQTKFHENHNGITTDVTSHPWSAVFNTVYNAGEVTKYSFYLGRTIYPSSAGGLYQTDQVRVQYDHDYTQRLHFQAALRVFRDQNVSGVINNDWRNYGTATVRGQYMLTQRIFVSATYNYIYQKYRFDPASADANIINVAFGYRGLERQQR